ncbi:MAG: sortase [Anaerolineales bacterium]|nr:sortase [Anaerolineales bacterium]
MATAIATAQQGENALAKSMFTTILQSDPENETAWLWMSQLVDADEHRIYCLIRVLMINPRHPAALAGLSHLTGTKANNKADVYSKAMDTFWRGQVQLARKLFEHLVEIDPVNEESWLWMSRVTNSVEERTRCLKKVVEINPDNMHARSCLDRLGNSSPQPEKPKNSSRTKLPGVLLIISSLIVLIHLAGILSPESSTISPARQSSTSNSSMSYEPTPFIEREQEITAPIVKQSAPFVQTFEPGSLIIPELDINIGVVNVPLQEGVWDISTLGNQIGLLDSTGRMPGDERAMVFIGHVTLSALENGPFYEIRFLQSGDQLIYRWENVEYIYKVEDISVISPNEVDKLFSYGGDTILLVTCTNWSYNKQSYTNRSVTRAVLVEQNALSDCNNSSNRDSNDVSS